MRFLLVLIFFTIHIGAQQSISGTITDEEQNPIPAVLVMNMKNGFQTTTDLQGNFSVSGSSGDEVRFVRNNYDRISLIFNSEISRFVTITLIRAAAQIEEVQVSKVKLTGNLDTDAQLLAKRNPADEVQASVGVPKPPEKPREKPADLKRDVLKPLLFLAIKPQAIYDLISGDARRKKSLYRYQDFQDNISWVSARLGEDYFSDLGIKSEEIPSFIAYTFYKNPAIIDAVNAKNLSKAMFLIEELAPVFLKNKKVK